jgi:hypothetical protein
MVQLPLSDSEARLLRSVLEVSAIVLREDCRTASDGLRRRSELFVADELSNIRERLESLFLQGVKTDAD